MYRRSKFMETLLAIREEMAREADYDTDLFAELVRSGRRKQTKEHYTLSENNGRNGNSGIRRKVSAKPHRRS